MAATNLSISIETVLKEGHRFVSVDPNGSAGSPAAIVAASIALHRTVLLVVATSAIAEQAVSSLEPLFRSTVSRGLRPGAQIVVLTAMDVRSASVEDLARRLDDVILDDRRSTFDPDARVLAAAFLAKKGGRVVEFAPPESQLDFDVKQVRLDASGSRVDTPQDHIIEAIEPMLAKMDNGRKNCVILVDRQVVPATMAEMFVWGLRNEGVAVSVGRDEVYGTGVSTAFVASIADPFGGPSRHFETFVEGRDVVAKYATWEEAEAGHRKIVDEMSAENSPPRH